MIKQKERMRPIKDFWCDYTPTDEEMKEAIKIASESDCVVILRWFVKYDGYYKMVITKETDFEKLKNGLPRIYGI